MEEKIPIDGDKTYKNRLQQLKDIIRLSSLLLILTVWIIVSFLLYQNRLLQQKISAQKNQTSSTRSLTPTPKPTLQPRNIQK